MAAKKNGKKSNGFGATVAEHMAKAHPNDPIERRRYHQPLPCKIDPKVAEARGTELAKVIRERAEFLEERKSENAKARERRAFFDERIEELGQQVEARAETRSVECVDELIPGAKVIRTRRLDTGEVVLERPARAEELQVGLPLDAKKGEDDEQVDASLEEALP